MHARVGAYIEQAWYGLIAAILIVAVVGLSPFLFAFAVVALPFSVIGYWVNVAKAWRAQLIEDRLAAERYRAIEHEREFERRFQASLAAPFGHVRFDSSHGVNSR